MLVKMGDSAGSQREIGEAEQDDKNNQTQWERY